MILKKSIFFLMFLSVRLNAQNICTVDSLGQVNIVGTAVNTSKGPILAGECEDYWISEFDEWPEKVNGKKVKVNGELLVYNYRPKIGTVVTELTKFTEQNMLYNINYKVKCCGRSRYYKDYYGQPDDSVEKLRH